MATHIFKIELIIEVDFETGGTPPSEEDITFHINDKLHDTKIYNQNDCDFRMLSDDHMSYTVITKL